MIPISRGSEPAELEALREEELSRVRKIRNPTSEQIGGKYRSFAGILRKAQHCKCCYCEIFIQERYNDVEHYRPKTTAKRKPGSAKTYGYWWLAWTWQNLLFACPGCNRSEKNDQFPLAAGSVPLVPEEGPPGREQPLLIDPADSAEENAAHRIQFVRTTLPNGKQRWLPAPRHDDERGRETIEVLDLGRDELLDLYRIHSGAYLMPAAGHIMKQMLAGNRQEVLEEWSRALQELRPYKQFVGLTYDVFDHFFPQEVRERWDLHLPVPNGGQARSRDG